MGPSSDAYRGVNIATGIVLALCAPTLGLSFRSVGIRMFRDLSSDGRDFWVLQAILLAVLTVISVPLRRRQKTWVSVPRLVIAVILLLSCLLAAGVSDGFRY